MLVLAPPVLSSCQAVFGSVGQFAGGCIFTPDQPEVCTWRPMAQTKPLSSRATATTALVFITRRAISRLNLPCSRNCAAQAMSVTAFGN